MYLLFSLAIQLKNLSTISSNYFVKIFYSFIHPYFMEYLIYQHSLQIAVCSHSRVQTLLCVDIAVCIYCCVQTLLCAVIAVCIYCYVQTLLCAVIAVCIYCCVQTLLCAVIAVCRHCFANIGAHKNWCVQSLLKTSSLSQNITSWKFYGFF